MPKQGGLEPLSEQQSNAVRFIEQAFWLHGGLPTNEQIAETLGLALSTVARYWQRPEFRAALIKRGIDLSSDASKGLLTEKQLLVANMMLNMHDRRSPREKLKEAEVTPQQYHVWLRQEAFTSYMRKRAESMFSAADADAYMSLIDTVRGGDTNAIKLFFEMRGIYTPRQQLDINIDSLMLRVVEIIGKYVRDPVVLGRIADEIESLGVRRTSGALSGGNGHFDLDI